MRVLQFITSVLCLIYYTAAAPPSRAEMAAAIEAAIDKPSESEMSKAVDAAMAALQETKTPEPATAVVTVTVEQSEPKVTEEVVVSNLTAQTTDGANSSLADNRAVPVPSANDTTIRDWIYGNHIAVDGIGGCQVACSKCYKGLWTNYFVTGRMCGENNMTTLEKGLKHFAKRGCGAMTFWKFHDVPNNKSWHHGPVRSDMMWHSTFSCPLSRGTQVGTELEHWKSLPAWVDCAELC